MPTRALAAALSGAVLLVAGAQGDEWPHYAGDATRSARAARAARDLGAVRWSVQPAPGTEYVWHSSPVVYGGLVVVSGRQYDRGAQAGNFVVAYDIADGAPVWFTPIGADLFESWSSPAVDVRNGAVIVAAGRDVFALDLSTGAIEWTASLRRPVVNASPLVTADLYSAGTPTNRAFITDYGGFGAQAELYAINVDPYEASANPHVPGAIVWTAALPGASGNTPAYAEGTVYVASVGGVIKALDARSGQVVWETAVDFSGYPPYTGFYGGVTLRAGFLYAAAYSFYGSGNNSGLFKLDAGNGQVVWSVACERSESIPIVADGGRVYLAAGIEGYGSHVKVQAFQDNGASVTPLWDTYVDSGGELVLGGWSHQPVWSRGYLYVGAPSSGAQYFLPYEDLYVLDVERAPGEPGFIVAHYSGAGGSPAVGDGAVYSLGTEGLVAFEPAPACLADLNADGVVTVSDLAALLAAYGTWRGDAGFDSDADLDRDGTVGVVDLGLLLGVYGAACP